MIAAVQGLQFLFSVGYCAANADQVPTRNTGTKSKAKLEAMLKER